MKKVFTFKINFYLNQSFLGQPSHIKCVMEWLKQWKDNKHPNVIRKEDKRQ